MIENALILAAGKGTRMWPLTEDMPKPLLPISGIPIIKRQIDELKKVGVKKLYILIGYQMNEISDYIDKTETEIEVNYIIQEKQKGTGHAVKMAENKIKGSFYCLNGDIIINAKNLKKINRCKDMAIMVTTVDDGSNFGAVKQKNGYLVSIIEKGKSGKCKINAGIFIFNESIFTAIDNTKKSIRGEYELTDALELVSNQIEVIEFEGEWKDIGNPWDLISANENYIDNLSLIHI